MRRQETWLPHGIAMLGLKDSQKEEAHAPRPVAGGTDATSYQPSRASENTCWLKVGNSGRTGRRPHIGVCVRIARQRTELNTPTCDDPGVRGSARSPALRDCAGRAAIKQVSAPAPCPRCAAP